MYFSEFWRFVRDNAAPGAILKCYGPTPQLPTIITIVDRALPRRHGYMQTGWSEEDHFRDSQVCNVTVLGGEVPVKGWAKIVRHPNGEEEANVARGAVAALKLLLGSGSVEYTDDVRAFLRQNDAIYGGATE